MKFVWQKDEYRLEYSNPSIVPMNKNERVIHDIDDVSSFTYDLSIIRNSSLMQIITVTANIEDYNFLSAIKEVKDPRNVLTDSCKDFCYVFDLISNSNYKTSASLIKETHEFIDYYSLYIKNYLVRDLGLNESEDDSLLLLNSIAIEEMNLCELNSLERTYLSFLRHSIYSSNSKNRKYNTRKLKEALK